MQYTGIFSEIVLFYVGLSSVSLVGMLYVVASIVSATYREATAPYLWRVALVFATVIAVLTYIIQLGQFQTLFTDDTRDRFMVEWAGLVRDPKCGNATIEQRVITGVYIGLPEQVFQHLAVVSTKRAR